ncbi:hypothetical protein B0H34DRAFT_794207 [Crassisporium funariophilum]|nr:hypothetical protein B0H34DRAFT_794207 [Crassisporium funariophilum]
MYSSTTYLLFAALLSVGINVLALPMGAPSVGLQNRDYNPTLETRMDRDLSQSDFPFIHHKKTTDASKKISAAAKAAIAAKLAAAKLKEAVKHKKRELEFEARMDTDLSQADFPFSHHKKTTDASKKISAAAKAAIAAKLAAAKVKEAVKHHKKRELGLSV